MATTPGPSRSCTADKIILDSARDGLPIAFGADVARHLERTRQVLARLIDGSLTAVFLIAGAFQAAFLLFMLAGQTFGRAHRVAPQIFGRSGSLTAVNLRMCTVRSALDTRHRQA